MRNVLVVKVLQSKQQLIHYVLGLCLANPRSRSSRLGDVREKVPAGAKLKKYMTEMNRKDSVYACWLNVHEFLMFLCVIYFIDVGLGESYCELLGQRVR